MNNISKFLIAIAFASITCASSTYAGGEKGNIGIGLSVSERSPLLSGIVWVGDKFTIEPNFAISRVSRANAATYNYFFGAGAVYHFRESDDDVRPMLGFRLDVDHLNGGGLSLTDMHYAGLLGADYYLTDNFAFRGEYRVTYLKTDENGSANFSLASDASYLTTSQQLSVIVYF